MTQPFMFLLLRISGVLRGIGEIVESIDASNSDA